MATRLIVNLSQTYIAMYLTNSLLLPKVGVGPAGGGMRGHGVALCLQSRPGALSPWGRRWGGVCPWVVICIQEELTLLPNPRAGPG